MPAHQAVWQLLVGPVPDGLTFDHLCLNHPCVNPDHGEIVTRAENARRSGRCRFYRSRTTCNFGHPFDGTTKNGRLTVRYCKTCARDRMRARSRTTLNEGIAA